MEFEKRTRGSKPSWPDAHSKWWLMEWRPTSGVLQGTVLGPLLFLVFFNDLPDNILSRVRLFADDCILYREIRTTQDCHTLQIDLNTLSKWEDTWGMEFHPQKCNVIACRRSTRPAHHDYHLKGTVLAHCTSSKYLGVDVFRPELEHTHRSHHQEKLPHDRIPATQLESSQ